MAEFYVNQAPDSDGARPVHRDACKQLPQQDTLLYLGSFASGEAAFDKANGLLAGVTFCPHCLASAA